MIRKAEILEEQAFRARYFPPDRIPFMGTDTAANADVRTFISYMKEEIGIDKARLEIANHNYLNNVTRKQFIIACKALGYGEARDKW